MPKLHPTKHLKITSSTLKKILKYYALTLISFKIFPTGIENSSVLVLTTHGKFVLRVYRKDNKSLTKIYQELEFMIFLRGQGLPVPALQKNRVGELVTVYKDSKASWRCIVMEYKQGIHPRSFSPTLIEELATTQARMHVLGQKFARTQKQNIPTHTLLQEKEFMPRVLKMPEIRKPEVKALLERVKKCTVALPVTLPQGYNHLDVMHHNILTQKGKLTAVLDFDDLCYSPRVLCLGITLFDVLAITRSVESMFEYLSAYSRTVKLTRQELKLLKDIILFRNYVMGMLEAFFYGEAGNDIKTCLKLEKVIGDIPKQAFVKVTKNMN